MIESITISDTVPFVGTHQALRARILNYVFGANGVGKTTISRIIANPNAYPNCTVTWRGSRPLQTLVLNRDFVDENFGQLKGIFTLGEKQKGAQEKIEAARGVIQAERDKRDGLHQTLEGERGDGGKKAELARLEDEFREKCWTQKVNHDDVFRDAFKGWMGAEARFKGKVLAERATNAAELKPYAELAERAKIVFGERPVEQDSVPAIDASALRAHESAPILKKLVIGKGDVDIAAMIEKLGNSDWVRQGRAFYDVNDATCPFCQQKTDQAFARSLEAYFDESYIADKKVIDALVSDYRANAQVVQQAVASILAAPDKFVQVETEKLRAQNDVLDGLVRENLQILQGKQEAPSHAVELKSLAGVVAAIKGLIDAANAKVAEHNRMVRNLDSERDTLKAQVWRYVLNELAPDMKAYDGKKAGLEKAIQSLEQQITGCDVQITGKTAEIRALEKQATSIRPTVDYINDVLKKFGFTSFSLAIGDDDRSYKLVRPTGEDAGKTLSEGEKSFVVFLYFYHLLRGSTEETGLTEDRVVVFDDPVSSLDSDILFIVSSLIREACEETQENAGRIKQVFVLTHNVYFQREVTFWRGSNGDARADESFWVVRKRAAGSIIEDYRKNPIKTSYELLWCEVRDAVPENPGLENTLRRILEYYFKVIGCTPLDKLSDKFDGADKLICRSLISWTNAGSHNILDPSFVTPSDVSMNNYLRVFRMIFEKADQAGHYWMMMGNDAAKLHVGHVAAGEEATTVRDNVPLQSPARAAKDGGL